MPVPDGKFFTYDELNAKVSFVLTERVFDDENTGSAQDETLISLMTTVDQEVISHAVKNYPAHVDDSVNAANAHPALKVLALGLARAFMIEKSPGVFGIADPEAVMDRAERKLRDLAKGVTHLQGAAQSNAVAETRSGVTLGGSNDRTFDSFGGF